VTPSNNAIKHAIDDIIAEPGGVVTSADNGSILTCPPGTADFLFRREAATDVPLAKHSSASDPKELAIIAAALPCPPGPTPDEPIAVPASTIAQPQPGYRPDSDKRWTTYYLAVAIIALALFCMAPALPHWNLGAAPGWARVVLLVSLLQVAYGAWVVSIPDWATLRASMVVLTAIAAGYGMMMTIALTTSPEYALPLDLTDIRRQAVHWCGCVMLLASLLAYFCGRAAWRWQRTLALLRA
jgi:hypothetical protein